LSSDDHNPDGAGVDRGRDDRAAADAPPARDPVDLLEQCGALVDGATDPDASLRALLRLLVPALGDYAFAYVREADGAIRTVASAHADDALEPLLRELDRLDPPGRAGHLARRVIESGRPLLATSIAPDALDGFAVSAEHARVLRALAPRSGLIAPIAAGARVLGALVLGTAEAGGAALRPQDLRLVSEIAARAALSLEHARLQSSVSAALDEQRRVADALRRERELLLRLIDTIPVMISLYRPDTRVLRVNREFERTLGWTSDQAEDASLLEQCYPDPEYRAEVQRFMQSLESGWRDFRIRAKDGRTVETSWANIRLSDDTQVGIGIDIGERKAAEQERARLYEAERRARGVAERLQRLAAAFSEAVTEATVGEVVMRHGVTTVGAYAGVLALRAGDDELEIRSSAGHAAEAGLQPGRRFAAGAALPVAEATRSGQAVFVGSAQAWRERYGSEPAAGRAWAALPVGCEAGERGALQWTFDRESTFSAEEREQLRVIARLCAVALERARLYDAERRAREAAETANRVKSQFLGIMSHELRTPLNAVLGYADLLLMELKGPLTPAQKTQVERVRTSARMQLDLIEEILTYARIEAGREELRLMVVDVRGVVDDAVDILRSDAERKSLSMSVQHADAALGIVTDPAKLRQILLNLIGNAVKFTTAGGVEVRTGRDEGGIVVRVTDTGPGIAADMLETIFQPFTQVDQSTTRRNGGTGLGLSIARRLARLLGGDVGVTSEPGVGSTFALRLPPAVHAGSVRLATTVSIDP
jgi:PAS domain S-box-containing protein